MLFDNEQLYYLYSMVFFGSYILYGYINHIVWKIKLPQLWVNNPSRKQITQFWTYLVGRFYLLSIEWKTQFGSPDLHINIQNQELTWQLLTWLLINPPVLMQYVFWSSESAHVSWIYLSTKSIQGFDLPNISSQSDLGHIWCTLIFEAENIWNI